MRDSFLNTFDLFSNHFKLGSDVLADLLCLDFNCVFKLQPLKFLSFCAMIYLKYLDIIIHFAHLPIF